MPFYFVGIDIIEEDWVMVEAPNQLMAEKWGKKHAAEFYKKHHHPSLSKYVEYNDTGGIEIVEPGEEKHYTIEAHIDEKGEEIKEG